MSLVQYKDATRKELWEILQIQAQVLEEEIRKNMVLEEENKLLKIGYQQWHELNTRYAELEKDLGLTRLALEQKVNQLLSCESALAERDEKLAELEKENLELLNSCAEHFDLYDKKPSALLVRDLEQQAKGLEDYVSAAMEFYFILHLSEDVNYHNFLAGLNAQASELRNQASKLKG